MKSFEFISAIVNVTDNGDGTMLCVVWPYESYYETKYTVKGNDMELAAKRAFEHWNKQARVPVPQVFNDIFKAFKMI